MGEEVIEYRSPVKAAGYAQIYHMATLDPRITDGAYRLFALYLMYAQQKELCWPGRERLAQMLKCGVATISRRNVELEQAGYITRKRRLSASTITYIEDVEDVPFLQQMAHDMLSSRIKNDTCECTTNDTTVVSNLSRQSYQICNVEEEQVEEEPEEEEQFFTPTSGEKQEQKPTKAEYVSSLQAVAGADPLSGAILALTRSQQGGAAWTVPPEAGGADPWDKCADAFGAMHGLGPGDLTPSQRKSWPRQLQRIAEKARASPEQMIQALRTVPEPQSQIAFKIAGAYSAPFSESFERDITMLLAKIATGQVQPAGKANGGGHTQVDPLAKAGYNVEAITKCAKQMAAK